MSHNISRRKFIGVAGAAAAGLALAGCGSSASSGTASEEEATTEEAAASAETPEVSTINWGRANSGNIFVTLGIQKGYFSEYGLEVVENPVANQNDAMAALSAGKVDVTSNQGTVAPCQQIAAGEDFSMIGGYMLQGMYLVGPKGTTWNGVEDLVGKKIAHQAPQIPVLYALIEAGLDPDSVEWVSTETAADRMAAVIAGEADYGYLSGDMLYTVNNSEDVDIVVYADELMPAYGCCRMDVRTEWIKSNPIATKLMLKALLRAEAYFKANKEECAQILAEELETEVEYTEAYLLNEHYVLSIDPVHNRIVDTWEIMKETGMVEGEGLDIDIEDHIDTSFYRAALDEVTAEFPEYADFWADREEFWAEYDE